MTKRTRRIEAGRAGLEPPRFEDDILRLISANEVKEMSIKQQRDWKGGVMGRITERDILEVKQQNVSSMRENRNTSEIL